MAKKYKTVLTHAGAAKIAAATAGGTKVNLTHMAVGDGCGGLPTPDPTQTKLIAEQYRAALNKISVDPKHKDYLVAELVIPPEVGGFWMREMGLYDETNTLIAVANMAESYKPLLTEGSGRATTVRMVIVVSHMDAVNLLIDSSAVLATLEYVDGKLLEHEQSRRHPDATLNDRGFTQLSSATNSNSETLAATPKAIKTVNDNANSRLAKDQNGADVIDSHLFTKNIGAARVVSGVIHIGGDSGAWSTSQFIEWLERQKAFDHAYWMCKGSWVYANNKVITDTGCGNICLAGSVIEVMGTRSAMTIRITTPTTVSGGGVAYAQFTYVNHGDNYSPGWRRDFNTRNPPTAAETGALSLNGGAISGVLKCDREIQSTHSDSFRIVYGNYGTYWRNDGSNLYLMLTNSGNQYGSYNSLRPFSVNLANGKVTLAAGINGNVVATGEIQAGSGTARMASDGNIYGTRWGDRWLYDYLTTTFQSKGNYLVLGSAYTKAESDSRYTPMGQAYTKAESISLFVRDVRLGANITNVVWGSGGGTCPKGHVLTGGNFDDDREYPVFAPIQKYINNNWYTVSQL